MPEGPDIIPIPVARPLSLSPNQFVASLETGFLRNACPLRLNILPKNIGQNDPKSANSLIEDPTSIRREPIKMQYLNPCVSMTLVDMKFAGR